MTPLREQFIRELTIRGRAERTIHAYVARLARWPGCNPSPRHATPPAPPPLRLRRVVPPRMGDAPAKPCPHPGQPPTHRPPTASLNRDVDRSTTSLPPAPPTPRRLLHWRFGQIFLGILSRSSCRQAVRTRRELPADRGGTTTQFQAPRISKIGPNSNRVSGRILPTELTIRRLEPGLRD